VGIRRPGTPFGLSIVRAKLIIAVQQGKVSHPLEHQQTLDVPPVLGDFARTQEMSECRALFIRGRVHLVCWLALAVARLDNCRFMRSLLQEQEHLADENEVSSPVILSDSLVYRMKREGA
jgi:hypothetical protein